MENNRDIVSWLILFLYGERVILMLEEKVHLLVKNSDILDDVNGVVEKNILKKLNALNLTLMGKVANKKKIEKAIKLIEMKTVWPSEFRGSNLMPLAINISLENDMDIALAGVENIYDELKKEDLPVSKYLMKAAENIYFGRDCINVNKVIKDTKLAYEFMKKNHKFETKKENVCAAAIISMTSVDVETTFKEINQCYDVLAKGGFIEDNELQILSSTLSLLNLSIDEKVSRVKKLHKVLKENKVELKLSGLPMLGIAAFITDDYEKLSIEILDLAKRLEYYSSFKSVTVNSHVRNLIALVLLIQEYRESLTEDNISVIQEENASIILGSTQLALATRGEIKIRELKIDG